MCEGREIFDLARINPQKERLEFERIPQEADTLDQRHGNVEILQDWQTHDRVDILHGSFLHVQLLQHVQVLDIFKVVESAVE